MGESSGEKLPTSRLLAGEAELRRPTPQTPRWKAAPPPRSGPRASTPPATGLCAPACCHPVTKWCSLLAWQALRACCLPCPQQGVGRVLRHLRTRGKETLVSALSPPRKPTMLATQQVLGVSALPQRRSALRARCVSRPALARRSAVAVKARGPIDSLRLRARVPPAPAASRIGPAPIGPGRARPPRPGCIVLAAGLTLPRTPRSRAPGRCRCAAGVTDERMLASIFLRLQIHAAAAAATR